MHKPRYRRAGRGWFGSGTGRYGRLNLCVMAGTLLLLGSVCLLQVRLAEDGKRRLLSAKNNRTAYSLDAMEREKMRLLREGDERAMDLEREYKIMLAEEGEGGGTEGEATFDDELEAESGFSESEKEKEEDEEDGGERFEELDAEMDMEDEDVDEFESFQGDVGEWLNEVDEFSAKKGEAHEDSQKVKSVKHNIENSAEGLKVEGDRSRKVDTKERAEDRGGLEESKSDIRFQSGKDILTALSTGNKGQEQHAGEVVHPKSEEVDKKVTKELIAKVHNTGERNSIVDQTTILKDTSEPAWIQSLGQQKKKTEREVSVSSAQFTTKQALKIKSGSNTYFRGGKNGVLGEESMLGAGRVELADGDKKRSTYLKDSVVGRGVFSTDDEPIDDDTLRRMENMLDFEDVLMIKKNPSSSSQLRSTRASDKELGNKDRRRRSTYDPFNPANNPLLQDPDTNEVTGLTKSDRVLLKARRQSTLAGDSSLEEEDVFQSHVGNVLEKNSEMSSQESSGIAGSTEEVHQRMEEPQAGTRVGNGGTRFKKAVEHLDEVKDATKKIYESFQTTTSARSMASIDNQEKNLTETFNGEVKVVVSDRRKRNGDDESQEEEDPKKLGKQLHKLQTNGDTRRWGHFPGLHPKLSFTGFMEEFLSDRKCSLRVFMAWTTPPWSYTIRHQRVLESLLYFHPDACVVVFSESIELTFFQSFVDEGYRVAVAMPQLQELLEDTPSEVFAAIYLQWRDVNLFYLHYTELLRLAALYKYGGIYLDMDMIVLKPLTGLHNTLGSEILPNGHTRPNGAAMFFERFSPFLNACMVEYTATYDEKSEEWNGAALLDRVVNERQYDGHGVSLEVDNSYSVKRPSAFFPLSSTDIFRYFVSPEDETTRIEEDVLYNRILDESYTVHLWNALTSKLVPEPGSLVHRLMERKCMRCLDIL